MTTNIRSFSIVVAATRRGGIGKDGILPWPTLSGDLKMFQTITTRIVPPWDAPSPPPERINAVIMGRKTWESIPFSRRPLAGRYNIIISSTPEKFSGINVTGASSLQTALEIASSDARICHIFVIGGGHIYEDAFKLPMCQRIYLTQVLKDFPADVFIPAIDTKNFDLAVEGDVFTDVQDAPYQMLIYIRKKSAQGELTTNKMLLHDTADTESKMTLKPKQETPTVTVAPVIADVFEPETLIFAKAKTVPLKTLPSPATPATLADPPVLTAKMPTAINIIVDDPNETKYKTSIVKNAEEQQYLDIVRDVIEHGIRKSDRTGIGTLSKFGCMSKYSLRNGRLPLLTTKRVFWRGVVEELIWLINGRTGAKELQDKGVRIWDANGTRSFLDSLGLHEREEFDLGPIYGHQWRFFGAKYVDCHTDYKGQGIDQLLEVVNLIKNSPDSRRILMSAWNPVDLKSMALPPCHVLCQFYVANGELSCIMYQRSCDLGLGVPFNIASYALLTHVMAQVCGLKAGDFCHMMGDTHVYLNHVEPLRQQVLRTPGEFPKLAFKRPITDITKFTYDDLELIDYHPQGPIKMDMAV